MASMRDLTRLINGLSLIANEFAKRSLPARAGDFETLIKNALLSATDLSGITRGKVRQFSHPSPSHASSSSVVFSSDLPSSPPSSDSTPPPPPPAPTPTTITNNDNVADFSSEANHREEASGANVSAVAAKESEIPSSAEPPKQVASATASGEVPLRKRRPRERKVPSTPFSRALGLVFFSFSI